jgi:hypothetical protein
MIHKKIILRKIKHHLRLIEAQIKPIKRLVTKIGIPGAAVYLETKHFRLLLAQELQKMPELINRKPLLVYKKKSKAQKLSADQINNIDWKKTNVVIAKELGVSHQRISQIRATLGIACSSKQP